MLAVSRIIGFVGGDERNYITDLASQSHTDFIENRTVHVEDSPEQLWLLTREGAGISKEFYDEYFCGREVAFAYKLGSVHIFETPKELSEFGVKVAPQSYIYIK